MIEADRTDTGRLDWISARRVVVMRANTRPECWKVEAMDGPYIRGNLRDAIDAAMEHSDVRGDRTDYDRLRGIVAALLSACRKIRDEHSRSMQELVEDDAWTFGLSAGLLIELNDAIADAEQCVPAPSAGGRAGGAEG